MKYLLIIICLVTTLHVFAQKKDFRLNLSAGVGCFTSYDPLINSYHYSGASPKIVQLKGRLQQRVNLFQLQVLIFSSEGNPQDYNELLYEYNYNEFQAYSFDLTFLREVISRSKMKFLVGGVYQSSLSLQKQYYKNMLYSAAEGYRESYYFSIASIALQLQVNYQPNLKNGFELFVEYGLLSYAARPTDSYVKQLGIEQSPVWKMYWGQDYGSYHLGLAYTRNISETIDISLEALSRYKEYGSHDNYAQIVNSLLLGVTKYF
ncbi:MAG: hypothetical protein OCD76_07640 [Reichenbachiella sp.]